jgi:hypothetical protein
VFFFLKKCHTGCGYHVGWDAVVMLPKKYMASQDVTQCGLVMIPHLRMRQFVANSSTGPGMAPRLAYSKEQRDKLEATAKKVEEFPFNLESAAKWLRSLAFGSHEFMEKAPGPLSMLSTMNEEQANGVSIVSMRPDLIEPHANVKHITAVPAKRDILRKKRRRGRGRMNANSGAVVDECDDERPPVLLPETADQGVEVLADGDLAGIATENQLVIAEDETEPCG